MNKYIASSLALACGLAVSTSVGLAQTATKIGVINLQQAVPSTQEGQAAVAKLQREFVEPATKKLEAQQAEIRDLTEKLQRGANTLSQTAKDDQQKTIDLKTKIFNRNVEDYQADSEEHQRKLLDDLSTKMRATIDQYLKDNNYSILLDSASQNSGLIWAAPSVEITQAVIDAYDKTHPVAAGSVPTPAKPAAPGATPAKPAATPAKPAAGAVKPN